MKQRRINHIGKRYGRLTVVSFHDITWNNMARWRCQCDCGKVKIVRGSHLKLGQTQSCGCYKVERTKATAWKHETHGLTQSLTYGSWSAMKSRCENPGHEAYDRYGGRGIKVCERWHKFESFLEDMGERPSSKHSIERENNDGDYEPANCIWATSRQQGFNKSTNRILTHQGQSKCLSEWSEITGIWKTTIRQRLVRGWSVARALTEAVK